MGGVSAARAGAFEDGMAAHARGDFAAAHRLLEPLAQADDPAAQCMLGRYRDGRDPSYAHLWLSLAGMRAGPPPELAVEERDRLAATLPRRELGGFQLPRAGLVAAVGSRQAGRSA